MPAGSKIPPLALRQRPGLSETLPYASASGRCASCGRALAWEDERAPSGTDGRWSRWREGDPWDRPSGAIVALCSRCAAALIEPHPREYRELEAMEGFPGAVPLCDGCPLRAGWRCRGAKAQGGPGVYLRQAIAERYHVFCSPRRNSGWITRYADWPTGCRSGDGVWHRGAPFPAPPSSADLIPVAPMKALAIWQPFASLLALGAQHGVTFKAPPNVSGPIALYAMPAPSEWWGQLSGERQRALRAAVERAGIPSVPGFWPTGALVGVGCLLPAVQIGRLVRSMTGFRWGADELLLANYADDRYLSPADDQEGTFARLPEPIACQRPATGSAFFDLDQPTADQLRAAVLALDPGRLRPAFRQEVERLTTDPGSLGGPAIPGVPAH